MIQELLIAILLLLAPVSYLVCRDGRGKIRRRCEENGFTAEQEVWEVTSRRR